MMKFLLFKYGPEIPDDVTPDEQNLASVMTGLHMTLKKPQFLIGYTRLFVLGEHHTHWDIGPNMW